LGWRERDWAKLTDSERRALWGLSRPAAGLRKGRRHGDRALRLRAGAGIAIAVSATLVAAGHLPQGHPLLPALHVPLPTSAQAVVPQERPRFVRMRGPRTVRVGALMTNSGVVDPSVSGPLLVQARWKPHAWKTLGGTYVKDGEYRVSYRLKHRGIVHVRISLPDGTFAIATIRVV
jgi:hypothetical protein